MVTTVDSKPAPVKQYAQVRIVFRRCAATNAHAMPDVKCHASGGIFSSCHAVTADNDKKIEAVRPNPNQKPYQVHVVPLNLNSTAFIELKTASASGPRLFCRSIPPIVCPVQKNTSMKAATL
jgi:hypothetical protein